jgi:glycosyltransferase involved in cell wall biosynthesis
MRIHVYLREFPPAGDRLISGMVKAVHGLAAGFVHNGAQVTILCDGPENNLVRSPSGYEIRSFACNGSPTNNVLPRGLERYIVQCDDPGIFLLNGIFNPGVYLASRVCRKQRISYIVAPHDPYHPSIFGTNRHLKWPYWYLREKSMLKQARAVQVLDFRHAEWLRALGVHTPIIEVLNGYAPEDMQPESALTWRMEGPARLLYLGRIDYHNKGLDLLLEAFSQLGDQTDSQLTLQGPDWGDLNAMLRLATKLGLNERVKFCQPDFEKPSSVISSEHDVFLLPSRFEGFGLSALEAMLAGRVLMVSDVAGIAPHVRASGCGVVISPDVPHIKSGLMDLLSQRSNWKEMGLAGRNYAIQHLRWDRIAADALKQYQQILAPRITRTITPSVSLQRVAV